MRPYDPLYGIGTDTQEQAYDVVVACEVLEHVRSAREEVLRISRILRPGGYVLVRTELYNMHTDFASWWYARDITHVNFFRLTSMLRVAELLNRGISYTDGTNTLILG